MATAAVRKRRLQGLLFISPWIIGFVAFTLYPLHQLHLLQPHLL